MADIIDSRDLATELDELEACADAVADWIARGGTIDPENGDPDGLDPLNDDQQARLAELRSLADAVGSEWPHGETLIPEEDFVAYAEQLAEDIGAIDNSQSTWPSRHIDWQAAAHELRSDYNEHVFDGINYLFRA